MAVPTVVQRVLDWLHAGYPAGVPQQDYFPLLALLSRSLTQEELTPVVAELIVADPDQRSYASPDEAIRAAIEAVTKSPALESDVHRVRRHLEAVGAELPAPTSD